MGDFVRTSGSAVFRQYNVPEPSVWPRVADDVAERLQSDKLPSLIAEGIRLYEEDKEKRENTWRRRLQRYSKQLAVIVATAVIGALVGWYLALQGFK